MLNHDIRGRRHDCFELEGDEGLPDNQKILGTISVI